MNRILSTTIAALIAAGASGAALADKPAQDQSVTPASPTPTATQTPPTDQAYNHGNAVCQAAEAARAQDEVNRGALVREAAHTQRDFMQFDADQNGTLSSAELAGDADLTSNFSALDKDGDGIISRTEFDGHLALDTDDGDED